jgi:hypothetical protein
VDVEGGLMEWYPVWKGRVKSTSAIKQAEAAAAVKAYVALASSGVRASDVAVITTYRAQSDLIRKAVRALRREEPITAALYREELDGRFHPEDSESLLDLRVSETVDSYQGEGEGSCAVLRDGALRARGAARLQEGERGLFEGSLEAHRVQLAAIHGEDALAQVPQAAGAQDNGQRDRART